MAVGNGHRTLFWDHSWATDLPLSSEAIQPIPDSIKGATVSEMWDSSTGWKLDLFRDYLPSDILKRIASHEMVEDMKAGDLVYWKGSTHRKFSIKYALKIIRNEESPSSNNQWELVWRAPAQQRIRAFMWLLMHDRLVSNANRVKRRISDDPGCPRCDGAAKGAPGLAGGAELKAVAIGLELLHEMGFMKVIVQMDNAACIQSLLKEDYSGGDCYFILAKVTYALANQGVQQTERLLIFHEILDGLGALLNNDIAGIALPRLVTI
ncbi:hypothetical protein RDABS01_007218 [Bienertia sinuspersici]